MTIKIFTIIAVFTIALAGVFAYNSILVHLVPTYFSKHDDPSVSVCYVGVYDYNVFIVTTQPFSQVRILNHTFIRGGPITVNPSGNADFIASIYSPLLSQKIKGMTQVQVTIYFNGTPDTLLMPVKVLSSPIQSTGEFYPPTGPIPL
ncbi:hypothetical protein HS7_15580 [Sulfolobales archaeon HS-7]|nr:hypothetical protein HS7_15580 [Sulfolobales archaeon HS-7]